MVSAVLISYLNLKNSIGSSYYNAAFSKLLLLSIKKSDSLILRCRFLIAMNKWKWHNHDNAAPPHLRTSALPQLRTSAPPHLRTSALPHLRTSAPPQVRLKFGGNMVYGTNNQVVEFDTSFTVFGINLKTSAKHRNLFAHKTPQLIYFQNSATYSLSKHRNLFTHRNQPRLEATPTLQLIHLQNAETYSLTKHRNLFTLKTPQLIHSPCSPKPTTRSYTNMVKLVAD